MFEKYLQEIGLSDKESVVYLALLGFENASVLDLAKKTSIKRPTVYTALESLAKKGLVSEITLGKKVHYYAESPEKLETFVERKKLSLQESERVLKDIIPQLKSLSRESGQKPVVKYFEGKEGIFSAHQEILSALTNEDEPTYSMYPNDLIGEMFNKEELEKFRRARVNKNIKSYGIYTSQQDRPSDKNSERIRIDQKKYPITADISMYKDTVLFSVLGKRISAILIKNQDVTDTLKSLFKYIFDLKK